MPYSKALTDNVGGVFDKEIICLFSDSVTIGDNVKVRACVQITDTDVCIGSRLSHGHYCFVCWRRKCTS